MSIDSKYGFMACKIPLKRIGVVIGKDGQVKDIIEKNTQTRIEIDSKNGSVTIYSTKNTADPLSVWKARDIVLAIGRGFSPERAFRLFDEDEMLEIIDLNSFIERSRKSLKRIKGRLIGERGKSRRLIEEMTSTYVSVFGHTVGLIGTINQLQVAREAIKMLITGAPHSTVYKFLNRKRIELKKAELEIWKPIKFTES